MARIYVASSWRNKYQPEVVAALRKAGHEVYDFRNPEDNPGGFHWADVDENWQDWQPEEYIRNLTHPVAEKGFKADMDAMLWADSCVLVLPRTERFSASRLLCRSRSTLRRKGHPLAGPARRQGSQGPDPLRDVIRGLHGSCP